MSLHDRGQNSAQATQGNPARYVPRLAAGEARCRVLFDDAIDAEEQARLGRLLGAWRAALDLSPILAEPPKRST